MGAREFAVEHPQLDDVIYVEAETKASVLCVASERIAAILRYRPSEANQLVGGLQTTIADPAFLSGGRCVPADYRPTASADRRGGRTDAMVSAIAELTARDSS